VSIFGCESYCPHGAKCMREPHVSGNHRSSRSHDDPTACEWTTAEGITREQADAALIKNLGVDGMYIVAEQRATEMFFAMLHEYRSIYPHLSSFTCPDCKAVSYNSHDIANSYCGNCHEFKGD